MASQRSGGRERQVSAPCPQCIEPRVPCGLLVAIQDGLDQRL